MNKELEITSHLYGLLAGVIFIGYFLFEIPSNLMLHKSGARLWIARIPVTWGIVAVLGGFAHSVHQMYVARFLLGLAEAGFAPGILLYLTYWFRQREQAQAVGLYLSGMPIAGILGSPVSGMILDRVLTATWYSVRVATRIALFIGAKNIRRFLRYCRQTGSNPERDMRISTHKSASVYR